MLKQKGYCSVQNAGIAALLLILEKKANIL